MGLLASLLVSLSACTEVHPVSPFHETNVRGAPGSAGDMATDGQGDSTHGDNDF